MEVVMQQHSNIETAMNGLCTVLAFVPGRQNYFRSLQFATRLNNAINRQEAMGRHANWKQVDFDEDETWKMQHFFT
jgi:hypothetical protein